MTKDKLVDLFVECYNKCELSSKIAIHNTYLRETTYECEDEIESNEENFFITWFHEKPMEAVRASYFGKYNFTDEWVWFNAYGNLESGNYETELPLRDAEEMAEWYIENYDEIDYITEMEEFCNECENVVYEVDDE